MGKYMAPITPQATPWQLERRWLEYRPGAEPAEVSTIDLSSHKCVAMLGAAGSGKTTESKRLADLERGSGKDVRWCRLAEHSGSSNELSRQLARLSEGATHNIVIYLDALDEAMVPLRRAWLVIRAWLKEVLGDSGAAVRITCRSAVWPEQLATALHGHARGDSYITAILQPLTDTDIHAAAQAFGVDADIFVAEIASRRAIALARQPLTLRMLLGLYAKSSRLPSTLSELFEKGLLTLAADRYERFEIGTALDLSPEDLITAAERLACYSVLTGLDTIKLGDNALDSSLDWADLSALNDGATPLDRERLRAIGSSGLFDSDSPASFRFGHRQFAEYLAGRRLARMLAHQARSLLASPAGWKSGVAGPLRETAAFAAMSNNEIASWLARYDPEVVGLSDVADAGLRRTATLGMLDLFRNGQMTDAQVSRGELELHGFQYPKAENDLRPVLHERGTGCEDVLECAIEFIESWHLTLMSDNLADLVLDTTAPQHARKAAAYALLEFGSDTACERLKPLAHGTPEDEHDELKGLAIRCNWPTRLTVPELLRVLTPQADSSFHGAYDGLLFELEREGFAAEGHLAEGLRWARGHLSSLGDSNPAHRIVIRIAHAALQALDDPDVATALVELLQHCAARHISSPLGPLRKSGFARHDEEPELAAPLTSELTIRRKLIDALAGSTQRPSDLGWLAHRTPGMYVLEDFPWLLARSCDESLSNISRTCYLEIARWLPWITRSDYVDAWLTVRDQELVCSILNYATSINLESEQASRLRENWRQMQERDESCTPATLDQPPQERVLQCLSLAETKDPRFFFDLCQELTLEPTSTHYGFERFLTRSPGWIEADQDTRSRLVEAAKRLLTAEEVDDPTTCREKPLSSILPGCMAAMWLILEAEPAWFDSLAPSWWQRWCWYILRELHAHMSGEPEVPKHALFLMLIETSSEEVRAELVRLASHGEGQEDSLLSSLLQMMDSIPDAELDEMLSRMLSRGEIRSPCLSTVAQFILSRAPDDAAEFCVSLLSEPGPDNDESPAIVAAVSLLNECAANTWPEVSRFVRDNEQHGRRVLQRFAHGSRRRSRNSDEEAPLEQLSASQLGELASLLLHFFPPEADPHRDGAYWVGPDDSARDLRDQLISGLGNRDDREAVEALREIERQFGRKYPWIRRPRARAERSYRLSQWISIPLDTISALLASEDMRLVRSEEDVLSGIEAAIENYSTRIRQDGSTSVDDLWNRPKSLPPSPKAEEHISSKLCGVIREYFEKYAITADREVEIYRRTVSEAAGGEPGSELDILVQAPSQGSATGSRIRVPIEVKLSCNDEAKSGMKNQLVDRYIPQLGATHGAYVVAWMSIPNPRELAASHKPKWSTIDIARSEIELQAKKLSEEQGVRVKALVLDAALR